jgi:YVTN family beta-propeller protein
MGLVLGWPVSTWAQALVDTLPVAGRALAVNSATNKIYVTGCTNERSLVGGVLVAIDGATKLTTEIGVGLCPKAVAVNPVTNKIYVANIGDAQGFGSFSGGSITIVDGATNSTMTVSDPHAPCAVAVNSATNKIYVTNLNSNDVTVIDGDTNSLTTIADPNAISPVALAVNPITNKIYVANQGNSLYGSNNPGSVTVIDGATGSTTTVSDPNANTPNSVAVNTSTDKIYVANTGSFVYSTGTNHGNVTVIDGATNSTTTVTDPNALAPGGPDSRGFGLAVDTATNSIYVVNQRSNNVSVIDGATNSTTTITDPNAFAPVAAALDPVTNRIYVANAGCSVTAIGCQNPGSVTVINGATKSATTIIDPKANAPEAVAVDAMTNQIYVLNEFSGNVTVIDGGGIATAHTLAVLLAGSGSGTVTSNPAGIDCDVSSCIASFAVGTKVRLSASAASGSQFFLWSGGCQAGPVLFHPCDLTTNQDQFVTATFNSTSPVQVVVPNVVGQTRAAATTAITGAGLVVGTATQQASSTVASGHVISESPAPGTTVASGSAVNLVVSTGPVQVAVPNVVGQAQAAATMAITGAGLVVGTVTQHSSSTVASGDVISESPAAGTNLTGGSTVNLVVSSGGSNGGGGYGGGGGIDSLTLGALLSVLMATLRRVPHRTARSCIRGLAVLSRTTPETGPRRELSV